MFKVCILGPANSGKSYFICSIRGKSKQDLTNTIGIQFFKHQTTLESHKIQVHYWDICGKKSYLSLTNTFVKNADIMLIFFNPINNTFKQFLSWASSFHPGKKEVYIIVNKPQSDAIPQEILKFQKMKKWKLRTLDAEHEKECEELQNIIISQNVCRQRMKMDKLLNFKKYSFFLLLGSLAFLILRKKIKE